MIKQINMQCCGSYSENIVYQAITSHWKKLSYTYATIKENIVNLTKVTLNV
jgi:hypothetical protein